MSGRLAGKVAVVVGAGSIGPGWGNGKATAVLFAREGARVLVADRNGAAAAETAAIIAAEGHAACAFTADATRAGEIQAMVDDALSTWGRIDVLVNNVGIVEVGGPVEISEESWDHLMAVNVKSMYLSCREVLPIMERQRAGAIVNVSSVAALRWVGYPAASYCASKGAVNQLTQNIAIQYAAKGIRANCILPGLMNTPMVHAALADTYGPGGIERMVAARDAQSPTGKMGDAWDVAHAGLFLASDEAKYVNGHMLVVDGGLSCKFS
jgi:NAD(P)-dependent dehydrogenase (short-subunit alcohol dehydrogenase family)